MVTRNEIVPVDNRSCCAQGEREYPKDDSERTSRAISSTRSVKTLDIEKWEEEDTARDRERG